MSVNPGFGGQSFIASSLDKIRELRQKIDDKNLSTLIQIDGGVNADTIAAIAAAGVDVFVSGSAIFNTDDYQKSIDRLRRNIGG
jgi:ribulose-phosphate 3-epimerase